MAPDSSRDKMRRLILKAIHEADQSLARAIPWEREVLEAGNSFGQRTMRLMHKMAHTDDQDGQAFAAFALSGLWWARSHDPGHDGIPSPEEAARKSIAIGADLCSLISECTPKPFMDAMRRLEVVASRHGFIGKPYGALLALVSAGYARATLDYMRLESSKYDTGGLAP